MTASTFDGCVASGEAAAAMVAKSLQAQQHPVQQQARPAETGTTGAKAKQVRSKRRQLRKRALHEALVG
jgi:hypothetical protein